MGYSPSNPRNKSCPYCSSTRIVWANSYDSDEEPKERCLNCQREFRNYKNTYGQVNRSTPLEENKAMDFWTKKWEKETNDYNRQVSSESNKGLTTRQVIIIATLVLLGMLLIYYK